jgi:hypothetical protein
MRWAMTEVDTRQADLLSAVDGALSALSNLDDEARESAGGGVETLERVLSFTRTVVVQTDGELIPDAAYTAIINTGNQIAGSPMATVATARACSDQLLTGSALLPAARDRAVEQAVREAAANFQRSAAQRLNTIEAEATQVHGKISQELTTLREQVGAASATSTQEIDAHATAFDTKLTEIEAAIATQQQRLDAMLDRQNATFAEKQEERSAAFDTDVAAAREAVAEMLEAAKGEVDDRVSEIRRMEEESSGLVASIGLGGTAERYGDEATAQKSVADTFRRLTVVLALGAVGMAVFAVVHHANENSIVLAKLGVSAVLGGLATYTAKQSGRHRKREERARNLQLELTAFAPFIEPLPEPIKELERVLMTRKTFGNIAALPEGDDGVHNYGPLAPILDAVQKKLGMGLAIEDE